MLTVTIRCRPSVKAALLAAAVDGDRSLSKEIERRLEASLDAPPMEDRFRTIIREEIAADRERQESEAAEMNRRLAGLLAVRTSSERLTHLNGEPRDVM